MKTLSISIGALMLGLAVAITFAAWRGSTSKDSTVPGNPTEIHSGGSESQNVFVVLSGGASPLSDSYTQYLQAQAWTEFLLSHYSSKDIWIFFGAGNRMGDQPRVNDVHRLIGQGGKWVDDWFPGSLPQNNPATRDVFLKALTEQILPRIRSGGTLYLLVGDHGSLGPQNNESNIVLWHFSIDGNGQPQMDSDPDLPVAELRAILGRGLGKGHVLFCMTQCFSGGFHFLTLSRELQTDGVFDENANSRLRGGLETLKSLPGVAGFTSTTELNAASGCLSHIDLLNWQGFDRRFAESLSGKDLVSGKKIGEPMGSFAQAFQAAVVNVSSIDQPYATSDQLLYQWANRIEVELGKPPASGSLVLRGMAQFENAMNGTVDVPIPEFQLKKNRLDAFDGALLRLNPSLDAAILKKTKSDLDRELARQLAACKTEGNAIKTTETASDHAWESVVRPAWKSSYEKAGLTPVQVQFEKNLFRLQDNFLHSFSWDSGQLNQVYFSASFFQPDPTKVNLIVRKEMADWAAQRQDWIAEWATESRDPNVRKACAVWIAYKGVPDHADPSFLAYVALHRIYEHRSELAAWAFLYTVGEQNALNKLRVLVDEEETALPSR